MKVTNVLSLGGGHATGFNTICFTFLLFGVVSHHFYLHSNSLTERHKGLRVQNDHDHVFIFYYFKNLLRYIKV